MSEPCFSCEQVCCEWTALLWTALLCTCHSLAKAGKPQVSESSQGFPETSNLIILARIKILHILQQRNVIDKPPYSTCFGSHWSNQDGRLPRTYNLYILHHCTLNNYSTGCFFICSSRFSVPKWNNLPSQWGAVLHWNFIGKRALVGCNCFFILVLKIGRNR